MHVKNLQMYQIPEREKNGMNALENYYRRMVCIRCHKTIDMRMYHKKIVKRGSIESWGILDPCPECGHVYTTVVKPLPLYLI